MVTEIYINTVTVNLLAPMSKKGVRELGANRNHAMPSLQKSNLAANTPCMLRTCCIIPVLQELAVAGCSNVKSQPSMYCRTQLQRKADMLRCGSRLDVDVCRLHLAADNVIHIVKGPTQWTCKKQQQPILLE